MGRGQGHYILLRSGAKLFPPGRPVREYENLGESTIQGVSGGLSLPLTPPLEGGLTLRHDLPGALQWLEVEWTGAAEQGRISERAGELRTPAWAVNHLRGRLEVAGNRVDVGVENLFDAFYRAHLDPLTLHRPDRNFFLRVTRAF